VSNRDGKGVRRSPKPPLCRAWWPKFQRSAGKAYIPPPVLAILNNKRPCGCLPRPGSSGWLRLWSGGLGICHCPLGGPLPHYWQERRAGRRLGLVQKIYCIRFCLAERRGTPLLGPPTDPIPHPNLLCARNSHAKGVNYQSALSGMGDSEIFWGTSMSRSFVGGKCDLIGYPGVLYESPPHPARGSSLIGSQP